MCELGHKPQTAWRVHWHWVLAEPDAVIKKSVTARGHDALQASIPGFGERIFRILEDWLKLSLDFEQSLRQFSNFWRAMFGSHISPLQARWNVKASAIVHRGFGYIVFHFQGDNISMKIFGLQYTRMWSFFNLVGRQQPNNYFWLGISLYSPQICKWRIIYNYPT